MESLSVITVALFHSVNLILVLDLFALRDKLSGRARERVPPRNETFHFGIPPPADVCVRAVSVFGWLAGRATLFQITLLLPFTQFTCASMVLFTLFISGFYEARKRHSRRGEG